MGNHISAGIFVFAAILALPPVIKAQEATPAKGGLTAEEMAKANNPLANSKAFNVQNYYVPTIYENSSLKANTFLLRYASPFANGKVLARFTLPLNTVPTGVTSKGVDYSSGMGDLNFFVTYTFSKPTSKVLIGAGPQVVIPTATSINTGAGKWQLGGAFVIFDTESPALQYGVLVVYQASIAGQADRPSTSIIQAQPIALFQLGKGAYLRTTGLWNFDVKNNVYSVPVGFGAGHVTKAGNLVFNIFLEPQFTILHQGTGQPGLQLFAGINCQF